MRVLPFRNCFVGEALQIVPCAHGSFYSCAVLLALKHQQTNVVHHAGNEQCGYGVEYADFGCAHDRVIMSDLLIELSGIKLFENLE